MDLSNKFHDCSLKRDHNHSFTHVSIIVVRYKRIGENERSRREVCYIPFSVSWNKVTFDHMFANFRGNFYRIRRKKSLNLQAVKILHPTVIVYGSP